ncbi:MAG: clostripain-related cysteine peptidase, partial [Atribacterota bacterium]|nr:clostripain-related cysteine peptidase [Atribacterota bacterium]
IGEVINYVSDTDNTNIQSEFTDSSGVVFSADRGAYPVVTSVSDLARDKRTVLQGNGNDTVTMMIYMCGTDLEARGGMATSDLQEILNAEIAENVNIIVETGGTSRWQNSVIDSRTNQRYRILNEGLEILEEDLGRKSMVNPSTLSDFIRYSAANYPADRYMLIMWDHGGGSLSGYGYDQYHANDSMTLDEINTALKDGGCLFDLIGFDACLMATLETAIVLEPYADYMIASEEVEPGIGWYYTGWITALSENTSIPTIELGKRLIDDYVRTVRSQVPQSQATLSLVDLAEVKGTVPETLSKFASSANELIVNENYHLVSNARAGTKEFAASSRINQIDLIHFAENLDTAESKALADALRGSIKYNRTSTNITNANGLSVFFPYGRVNKVGNMLETYDEIQMDEEYSECIKSFASMAAGGQAVASGSGNLLETLLGGFLGAAQSQPSAASGTPGVNAIETLLNAFVSGGDVGNIIGLAESILGWLDIDLLKSSVAYYQENQFDASNLVISEKNGQRVLSLPEEQWELINYMEMNVFIDDGEGFIDLGLDNVYEYNQDGDLIMDYDGTWIALNGNIVSYYMVSDDHSSENYSIKGRVPAFLNNQLVDIIIVFDDENPYGVVLGAQIKYDEETQTETIAKGLLEILPGDEIDFLCDYYTYDGDYYDTYYLGDSYMATGEWEIENLYITNNNYQMTYRITDIYGNQYWTPSISD